MSSLYYSDEFRESKYHQVHHSPLRFTFVKFEGMSIKEEKVVKEYFESKIGISVRLKREDGISIFMCSEKNQKKAFQYILDHQDEITNKFKFSMIYIDYSIIQ